MSTLPAATLHASPFLTSNSQAPPDCNTSLSWSQLGEENTFPRCFFCGGRLIDPLDVLLLVWWWWCLTAVVLVVSYVNFMLVSDKKQSWYTTLLPMISSEMGLSNTLLDTVEVAHPLERKRGIVGGSELDVDCDMTLGIKTMGTVSGWEKVCAWDGGAVAGCNGWQDTLCEWVDAREGGSSLSQNTSNSSHWASGTIMNKPNTTGKALVLPPWICDSDYHLNEKFEWWVKA